VRLWMDERGGPGISKNDVHCSCAVVAKDSPFASCLNSQARQASADRAWCASARFSDNCKAHKPGTQGYPRVQQDTRSIEDKTTGWKLEYITLTDGCGIGRVRLLGTPTQKSAAVPAEQIKRVRSVHRADGSYVQFAVKAEQKLKRLQRAVSRKQKKSRNRKKARKHLARVHLHVQRQREDVARKTASTLISSHDVIALEDVKIRTMVKNPHLAKSLHDAGWVRSSAGSKPLVSRILFLSVQSHRSSPVSTGVPVMQGSRSPGVDVPTSVLGVVSCWTAITLPLSLCWKRQ
jgi:putative transposase